MQAALQKRSIPIAALAFMQRAFARSIGRYKSPEFEVNVNTRSQEYLNLLSGDENSLTFRIALENLRREFDLLLEESALVPEGLELQRKVVELSARYEIANQLVQEMLIRPPMVRLFNAILTETTKAGANRIQIEFISDQPTFPVTILSEGEWIESMRIPATLAKPLRGVIARVQGIGYKMLLQHAEESAQLPTNINLHWLNDTLLEIDPCPAPDS